MSKVLLGMFTSRIEESGFEFLFHFQSSLLHCFLLIQTLGREHVVIRLLGFLPPMLEAQKEFLAPGFVLAQPWLVWAFGE